jgi:osmotically-inducible protein OsmY
MKQLLIVSLLLCLSFSIGCSRDRDFTTQAATEPLRLTDSQLQSEIKAALNSDAQLRAADLSVDADADENRARLSGKVESEELRTRAVQMARAIQAGLTVEDNIDVKPSKMTRSEYTREHARQEIERAKERAESIGDSLDDAWIHAKVVAQLIGDKDTPERNINVDVNNNIVTLRGTVGTLTAKEEAERIAKETDGVKGVHNRLKVAVKR